MNGTATNYGVILWATNEDVNGHDLRFYSSEYADTTARPRLEVTYSQTPRTVYFLKDHLGSIRATVQDTSTAPVCGYDDYDPWGYILAGRSVNSVCGPTSMVTRNKFTGKEWDDDYSLNWNYFGARHYDPQIGRWVSVHPLAEKYAGLSSYTYVANNPVIHFDPDGKGIRKAVSKTDQALFNKYLAVRNAVLSNLDQRVEVGGVVGAGAVVLREVIEFTTPSSLAELYNSSAMGLMSTASSTSGLKFKFTKSGNIDKRTKLGRELSRKLENLTAETKDVTPEFQAMRDALEKAQPLGEIKEADNILSVVENVMKTDRVQGAIGRSAQKVKNFFKNLFAKSKENVIEQSDTQ